MVRELFKVVFSPKAKQRLKEISDHYKKEAGETVSRKVRKGIVSEAKKLQERPERKPLLRHNTKLDYEVRYTKAWSYKIIYRILEKIKQIRILTIRHDKESPQKVSDDLTTEK